MIATLVCLAALGAQAQKKKPPQTQTPKPLEEEDVVRITTEIVQTDVMVFDKDGRFVNGLKPEQFQLLVDGKPQPIAFFESVVTGGKNEAALLKRRAGIKVRSPRRTPRARLTSQCADAQFCSLSTICISRQAVLPAHIKLSTTS